MLWERDAVSAPSLNSPGEPTRDSWDIKSALSDFAGPAGSLQRREEMGAQTKVAVIAVFASATGGNFRWCGDKIAFRIPIRPRHAVQIASRLGADPEPCGGCHSLPVLAPALREIVCSSLMRTC